MEWRKERMILSSLLDGFSRSEREMRGKKKITRAYEIEMKEMT
jgi:hypothetical protein